MARVAGACASMDREGTWDCEAQESNAPTAEMGVDVKMEPAKSEATTDCTTHVNTDFSSGLSLGDAECGCASPAAPEIVISKGRRCHCCRTKRGGLCACASLAIVGLFLFFLWPRNPEWKVKEITVSASVVNGLATAFMSTDDNSSAQYPLNASVVMTNHDWIGANSGAGHFVVSYENFKLAEAQTLPTTIGRRSSGTVYATSLAQVPSGASTVLLGALMQNNMHIVVDVVGDIPVHALGLTVFINLACQVEVDVMQLMEVPADMIGDHNCSYSYSLR